MIDTDKYTGHTPKPWGIKNAPHNITHLYGGNDTKICSIQTPDSMFAKTKGELKLSRECNTNARLIQDAPLLLEEVKRLRAEHERAVAILRHHQMTSPGAVGVKSSCGIASACRLILNILEGKAE